MAHSACDTVRDVYAGGRLLAIYQNGTTDFVHADQLGSTRLVTAVNQSIVDNMDYEPFGQQTAGGSATTHKFTGKQRDGEDGLDYFGARYYSSSMGRFLSPDWSSRPEGVPYAQLDNPQSMNLYGYVGNDPVDRVDPDGHMLTLAEEQNGDAQGQEASVDNGMVDASALDLANSAAWGLAIDGSDQNAVPKAVMQLPFMAQQESGFNEQNPQPGTPVNKQYVLVVENDSGGTTSDLNHSHLGLRNVEYDLRLAPVDKKQPLGGDPGNMGTVVISEHLSNPNVAGGPGTPSIGTGQFWDGIGSGVAGGGSTDRYFTVTRGGVSLGVVPIVDRFGQHNVDHITMSSNPRMVELNGTLNRTDIP